MNKYQEALARLKEIEKEYTFSKIGTRFHVNCDELQELVDKYQEIQNVYFKKEPMESADLNGEKLQELYNFINKLLDKATPKKIKGLSRCPLCDNGLYINQNFCDKCGTEIDWSDK